VSEDSALKISSAGETLLRLRMEVPRVDRARPAPGGEPDSRLKAACEDLESLFIHHMLSAMRKTVDKSGLIDGGRSEEIYTSLMDAELAKSMAAAGGLGLSAVLKEQLARSAPAPTEDRPDNRFHPDGFEISPAKR
jgi:Rod binding domain-containing protein